MKKNLKKSYKCFKSIFEIGFGFHQPYQVLVDTSFCLAVIDQKIEFFVSLSKVIQGEVKVLVPKCVIRKLQSCGANHSLQFAQNMEIIQCNHTLDDQIMEDCITKKVQNDNPFHYIVASNNGRLRVSLRLIPGVPIIYCTQKRLLLENPSNSSMEMVNQRQRQKFSALILPSEPHPIKKTRRIRNPNPLSVKKKKTVLEPVTAKKNEKKRRRRCIKDKLHKI